MDLTHKKSLPTFNTENLDRFSDENYLKPIIPLLNQNMSDATTKEDTFDIIVKTMDLFPATIIKDNFNTWMKLALNNQENEVISDLQFRFLGQLLDLCIENQDFHNIVAADYLSQIVNTCLSTSMKCAASLSSLNCLEKCHKIFPKDNYVDNDGTEMPLELYLTPALLKTVGDCMQLLKNRKSNKLFPDIEWSLKKNSGGSSSFGTKTTEPLLSLGTNAPSFNTAKIIPSTSAFTFNTSTFVNPQPFPFNAPSTTPTFPNNGSSSVIDFNPQQQPGVFSFGSNATTAKPAVFSFSSPEAPKPSFNFPSTSASNQNNSLTSPNVNPPGGVFNMGTGTTTRSCKQFRAKRR